MGVMALYLEENLLSGSHDEDGPQRSSGLRRGGGVTERHTRFSGRSEGKQLSAEGVDAAGQSKWEPARTVDPSWFGWVDVVAEVATKELSKTGTR
jgi:hypothetical protein